MSDSIEELFRGEKMQSIVLAELYKLLKRKNFIILAILSLWSLIYGFGAFYIGTL